MQSVVVHYQEIALKGKNRPWFIARLVRNLQRTLSDLDVRAVRSVMGRIEVVVGPSVAWETVRERISRVFGIANFSRAGRASADLDELTGEILKALDGQAGPTFRVRARRADKRYPLTSPEIERRIGGAVHAAYGWRANLDHPDVDIRVEILTSEAFYFFGRERGAGGLPSGASGRVLCLLSGGIDSPVAAYRMMRRGCHVQFVHFHSYPFLPVTSQEKVREIAALLARSQLQARLHIVAFGELQRQVVLTVPPALRVVVYRRLMLRIAEALARTSGSRALVTGEVVGQVASQTLENMAVIEAVTTVPVFRPLVGMDKDEITAEAQRIGTFEISITPDQDCCTLFTPRHPVTRARLEEIERAEAALPIAEMVRTAAAAAIVEDFEFPRASAPAASPPPQAPQLPSR
jgi:tRNA uracil 4-sulfurtransferase